jgi:hypothetical protein
MPDIVNASANVNNYGTMDPFQMQLLSIEEKLRLAAAQALRTGAPHLQDDPGGAAMATVNQAFAPAEIAKLQTQRQKLSDDYEQSYQKTIADAPEEVRGMLSDPRTRAAGMELYKQYTSDRLDDKSSSLPGSPGFRAGERGTTTAPYQEGGALPNSVAAARGADVPDPDRLPSPLEIQKMLQSHNPRRVEVGKFYAKLIEDNDPTHSARLNLRGERVPDVGLQDARRFNEAVDAAGKAVNQAPYQTVGPNQDIKQNFPFQQNTGQNPAQFLGITGQNGPTAPVGQPGATGVPPPPQQPVSAPNMPVSGLSGTPPPTAPGAAPGGPAPFLSQTNKPYTPQEIAWMQKDMAQSGQGPNVQPFIQQNNGGALPSSVAAQGSVPVSAPAPGPALPLSTGAGPERYLDEKSRLTLNSPTGQPNAAWAEVQKGQIQNHQKQIAVVGETLNDMQEYKDNLVVLNDLIHKPHYSGDLAVQALKVPQALNSSDPMIANTARIESVSTRLQMTMAKFAQANRATNLDLQIAGKTIPSVHDTEITQIQHTGDLLKYIERDEKRAQFVYDQGMNYMPIGASVKAWNQYQRDQDKANPTPPAEATQQPQAGSSALPQSTGSGSTWDAVKETAGNIGGFLTDKQSWKDMASNAVALPGALASNPGALVDATVDKATGIGQLFDPDIGDRSKAMTRYAEHQAKAEQDPKYKAAYTFGQVGNPINAAAMAGGGIPALFLGGAAASAEPKSSWTQSAKSAAFGGAVNTVLGGAGRFIPATKVSAALGDITEDVLNKFPSLRSTLTSGQVGERSVIPGAEKFKIPEQTKAVVDDLQTRAGLKPGDLSPQKLADGRRAVLNEENALFSSQPNVRVRVGTDLKNDFANIATQDANIQPLFAKSPSLASLHNALTGPNIVAISPQVIRGAYKDLERMTITNPDTATAVKGFMDRALSKTLGNDNAVAFKAVREKATTLEGLEKAYAAGTGKGELAAYPTLDAVKSVKDVSSFREATSMIDRFNVGKNLKITELLNNLGRNDFGREVAAKTFVPKLGAMMQNAANKYAGIPSNALGASPSTKAILETLRRYPRAASVEGEEIYNAP